MAMYARNPIVKNYLNKIAERRYPIDTNKWYYLKTDIFPQNISNKFELSCFDGATEEFLENCYEQSDWVFTQIFHNFLRFAFGWMFSMTTVNGLLNRGSMFVFSEKQFQSLLNVSSTWQAESILDLGAGDGKVTQKVLHHFTNKYATEQSTTMRWRLKEKGFQIKELDEWQKEKGYSVITALNLIDRIDEPMQLLKDIRMSIKDDGIVVLAVVLPYNPCYETGTTFRAPSEVLQICGDNIEQQIISLHDKVFPKHGFEVIKFTRLPYLCEGDLHHDYFVLTDIVFVLKPSSILSTDEMTCDRRI